MKKKILEALIENMNEALASFDISNAVSNAIGNSELTGKIVSHLSNMMYGIQKAMEGGALAIAILFFIIALLELAMSERMTLEFLIKFFSKLVVSVFLIFNCQELTQDILDLGIAFDNTLKDYGASIGEPLDKNLSDLADSLSEGDWVGLLFSLLIPSMIIRFFGVIVNGVVYIIAFTRLLELYIRGAFMPIALALISDDGWRGSAGRYIKKFIAIVCQGAVLVVIGNMSSGLMGAAANFALQTITPETAILSLTISLAASIATISIMFKSIGLVNDVFGA